MSRYIFRNGAVMYLPQGGLEKVQDLTPLLCRADAVWMRRDTASLTLEFFGRRLVSDYLGYLEKVQDVVEHWVLGVTPKDAAQCRKVREAREEAATFAPHKTVLLSCGDYDMPPSIGIHARSIHVLHYETEQLYMVKGRIKDANETGKYEEYGKLVAEALIEFRPITVDQSVLW